MPRRPLSPDVTVADDADEAAAGRHVGVHVGSAADGRARHRGPNQTRRCRLRPGAVHRTNLLLDPSSLTFDSTKYARGGSRELLGGLWPRRTHSTVTLHL